ncbi:hypothetical protein [Nocardia cyriacigeorgica]|uniref:Uncharacterized protein n=1 Tax=Nocardia cyriacigeorgica TaxID=135487 RepID=A0A6P1DCV8_9NOCA|nr:hypothetical protein [Nocardia cyriacigeorgica]NEW46630.1 hypothetical protein [Nocardia cyriacigeorgica]
MGQSAATAVAATVQVLSAAELAALACLIAATTPATGAAGRIRRRTPTRRACFAVRGVQTSAARFGSGAVAANGTGPGRVAAVSTLATSPTVALM